MPNCPHCSTELKGFVTQETLTERLDGQKSAHVSALQAVQLERDQLRSSLSTVQAQASGYDAVVRERDQLKQQMAGIEQKSTRTQALVKAGVKPELLDSFEVMYNAAIVGVESPPEWDAWLAAEEGGAKTHPLLAPHFGAPAGDAGAGNAPAGNRLPPPAPGSATAPPPPSVRMTQQDLANYLGSDEYRSLPPDKRREALEAKRAQWESEERSATSA